MVRKPLLASSAPKYEHPRGNFLKDSSACYATPLWQPVAFVVTSLLVVVVVCHALATPQGARSSMWYVLPMRAPNAATVTQPTHRALGLTNANPKDVSTMALPQQPPASFSHLAMASASSGASGKPLSERVFVVTGSTDGIGRFTAQQLARTGATVVVHGRNPGKVLRALLQRLPSHHSCIGGTQMTSV